MIKLKICSDLSLTVLELEGSAPFIEGREGKGRGEGGEEELILGKLGFVGFAKYPKVVQHRAIACWKQLDIPTKNMGGTILAPPPSEWGGVKRPRKKNFFSDFFCIFFRKEDGPLMLKNFFLNLSPSLLRGEGSKLKNFDF